MCGRIKLISIEASSGTVAGAPLHYQFPALETTEPPAHVIIPFGPALEATMAYQLGLRAPAMRCRAPVLLSFATGRPISTAVACRAAPFVLSRQPVVHNKRLPLQTFRRTFADHPPPTVNLSPPPPKKKRFRIFKWLWRITYLSFFGFVGWLGYNIYDFRNPQDQFEPDPNKKTLVVLGTRHVTLFSWSLTL